MKLGIFGGTFNPPHIGHLIVAENTIEQLRLDKMIFIPAYSPPHKFDPQMASPEQRYEMLELSIQNNNSFAVSDIEIKREGKSFTIDTINELSILYRNAQLYLIIGMDNLIEFPQWKNPNEIVARTELVVMNRPGFETWIKNEFSRYATNVRVPNIDISSSDIRRRIKMGRSIRYLVPYAVEQYIIRKGLYKK